MSLRQHKFDGINKPEGTRTQKQKSFAKIEKEQTFTLSGQNH